MPLAESKVIWMDGELVPWGEAKVHVLTHSLHYGLGVFEGIRAYETKTGPAVFRLTPHIERLFNSAKIYMLDIPFGVDELIQATKDVVRENGDEGLLDGSPRPGRYRRRDEVRRGRDEVFGQLGVGPAAGADAASARPGRAQDEDRQRPEAQLDRFMFNIVMTYLDEDEEV